MKNCLLVSALVLTYFVSYGQCPTTEIILTTQQEINDFATTYPNCTMLTDGIRIDGDGSNIVNLNGLSPIISAQDFYILNTQIISFNGLHNLVSTAQISIGFNHNIQNFNGLSALASVEEMVIWFNSALLSLNGAPNLTSVLRLSIFENASLSNISALSGLTNLTSLSIAGNAIQSLAGLENLETVLEDVFISNEPLISFDGLANITSIGGSLFIWNNGELQGLEAFSNISSLEDLYIVECGNLENLSGLENLTTLSGRLRIGFNSGLTDLNELQNITSVGDLDIYENENLQSLAGLENLKEIQNSLYIMDNANLDDISALSSVSPALVDELVIQRNSMLAVCVNPFICSIISDPTVFKFIAENSPGCSSIAEVEAACILGISGSSFDASILIYPNPVTELLMIKTSDNIMFVNAMLFSVLGQKLTESKEKSIDVSNLSSGVYFLSVQTNLGSITKRIIKE